MGRRDDSPSKKNAPKKDCECFHREILTLEVLRQIYLVPSQNYLRTAFVDRSFVILVLHCYGVAGLGWVAVLLVYLINIVLANPVINLD